MTQANYNKMRTTLQKLSKRDTDAPSTNFELFLSRLSSSNADGIKEINRVLEKEDVDISLRLAGPSQKKAKKTYKAKRRLEK